MQTTEPCGSGGATGARHCGRSGARVTFLRSTRDEMPCMTIGRSPGSVAVSSSHDRSRAMSSYHSPPGGNWKKEPALHPAGGVEDGLAVAGDGEAPGHRAYLRRQAMAAASIAVAAPRSR